MIQRRRRSLLLGSGASVVVVGCVLAYLLWPDGIGGVLFLALTASGLIALIVGPQLRRAEPRAGWRWIALAAGLFLLSLVLRIGMLPSHGTVFDSADTWSIAGYLSIARGLSVLLAHSTRGSARASTLDATIVTSGAALGFFSAEVGPHIARGGTLGSVVVAISYPVLDSLLLAITTHLAFRSWRRSPAMVLLLASMTTLLAGDFAYTVLWHISPNATSPWINAFFMVSYALIGAAAVHPSVRRLASPAPEARSTTAGSGTVMLLALLVPAAVAVLSPSSGMVDLTIRVSLLGTVLVSVVLRMRHTVNALSAAAAALEQSQQQALHQALHDALTGLPNRAAFRTALTERLDASLETGLTLLCLDSDHFKRINDSWGHPVGDAVIVHLGERLNGALQPGEGLFRLGGDEFVVVTDGDDPAAATAAAERLQLAMGKPFPIDEEQRITLTASIGMAIAPRGTRVNPDSLVRDADIALYAAKDRGRATWALFDDSLRQRLQRRVALAEELHDAVHDGQIIPFFQPIVTGPGYADIDGFEALARWISPARGEVSPVEFIPIAEDSGLIVEIGEQMLRSSCTYLQRWRQQTGRDLHVSVNVSVAQVTRSNLPIMVADVLAETGLVPSALWLEITESVMLQDKALAMRTLNELSDLGVVLCVDDFGTGYSSLGYLKDLPVDIVKMDRSFIKELAVDARSRSLAKAIIDIAAALELKGVVAEGVDHPDQAKLLTGWGCRYGQGFLWSKPLPPSHIESRVDEFAGATDLLQLLTHPVAH